MERWKDLVGSLYKSWTQWNRVAPWGFCVFVFLGQKLRQWHESLIQALESDTEEAFLHDGHLETDPDLVFFYFFAVDLTFPGCTLATGKWFSSSGFCHLMFLLPEYSEQNKFRVSTVFGPVQTATEFASCLSLHMQCLMAASMFIIPLALLHIKFLLKWFASDYMLLHSFWCENSSFCKEGVALGLVFQPHCLEDRHTDSQKASSLKEFISFDEIVAAVSLAVVAQSEGCTSGICTVPSSKPLQFYPSLQCCFLDVERTLFTV